VLQRFARRSCDVLMSHDIHFSSPLLSFSLFSFSSLLFSSHFISPFLFSFLLSTLSSLLILSLLFSCLLLLCFLFPSLLSSTPLLSPLLSSLFSPRLFLSPVKKSVSPLIPCSEHYLALIEEEHRIVHLRLTEQSSKILSIRSHHETSC
jgi:hypothetical protein